MSAATMFSQSYFHGSRADLRPDDLIVVGHASNFQRERPLSWVYFASTLDAAMWGAELAFGDGRQRIYVVEPSGKVFDDPNLTDKKFTGNPTMSYRSREPLRVIAEVTNRTGHPAEQASARAPLYGRTCGIQQSTSIRRRCQALAIFSPI